MMRTKIENTIIDRNYAYKEYSGRLIYIMDYSKQTYNTKGIECLDVEPTDIKSFIVDNYNQKNVCFCYFGDNVRINGDVADREHCEGVLFPTQNNNSTWIVFLELKYPKKCNLGRELKSARAQLFATLELFRSQNICNKEQPTYLIFSAPDYSETTPFENFCKMDYDNLSKLKKEENIILRGVNSLSVISELKIKV